MLPRRVFGFAIAVAAAGTMLLGGPHSAKAGIRLKVESGAETKWFYSTDDTFLATGKFTIGVYTGTVETTVTNFPGTSVAGTMGQTINVTYVGSSAADLKVTSTVIDDTGLGSLPIAPMEVTAAGDITLLMAATEKEFDLPDTVATYIVSSDASGTNNDTVLSGTTKTTTTVDGTPVDSLTHSLLGGGPSVVKTGVPDSGTPNKYTLNQVLVLSGVNSGARASTP